MSLAPLGFTVNTAPVAKAVGDLDKLTAATAKAQTGAKGMSEAANTAAASVQNIVKANDNATAAVNRHAVAVAKLVAAETRNNASSYAARAADVEAYGAELDQLRSKFNPVFAASKAYETELNELNRAHRLGAITAAEQGAALVALNARYQMGATGIQTMGTSAGMAQMQVRNLAFQFQDIGTMMASGQSPFLLLAQQLPQVTMYGGQLTGVMGALKSSLAGIFSPLGLLTTGFVLAGSAAIAYFSDASDDADEAADALAEQVDLIHRVADEWGNATPEIKAYADELDRALNMRELSEATNATIDARFTEARANISEVRSAIGDLISEMFRAGETSASVNAIRDAFNETDQAAQDLRDAMKEGNATAEDAERVNRALASLLGNEFVSGSDGAAAAIGRFSDALSVASGEAARLAASRALLEDRGGIPLSDFEGGRGSDPRSVETDDYYSGRYFPDPEKAARKKRTRAPRKTDAQRASERYSELIQQSQQFIAAQELEQQALYMTEQAAQALRYEQELLNQAANDNIKLTPEMTAELSGLAREMASTEAQTDKLKESFDTTRDAAKGVLSSLRKDLQDGTLSWESFGDAAMTVLDKIIDKLEDQVADAFANAFAPKGGASGGVGGILGGLLGIFGIGGGGGDAWAGMRVSAHAAGTNYAPGGLSLVGEEGPELVNLPRGSKVHTAGETRAMMAGANQNGGAASGTSTVRLIMPDGWKAEILDQSAQQAVQIVQTAAPAIADQGAAKAQKNFARGGWDKSNAARYGATPMVTQR